MWKSKLGDKDSDGLDDCLSSDGYLVTSSHAEENTLDQIRNLYISPKLVFASTDSG